MPFPYRGRANAGGSRELTLQLASAARATCVPGDAYRSGSPARLSSAQAGAYDRGRPSHNAHAPGGQSILAAGNESPYWPFAVTGCCITWCAPTTHALPARPFVTLAPWWLPGGAVDDSHLLHQPSHGAW